MRPSPRLWPVRDDREDGAVLVIVVLSLVALIGMLVLVVDVGSVLFARRQLVNGADAAALAAAQSCAKTNDVEIPEAQADAFATANMTDVDAAITNIVASETVNCDTGLPGRVTVDYASEQGLFFGPALGVGETATVRTTATAHWGGVGTADSVIPLVIYSGYFQGETCNVPDVPEGTTCYIWEDNDLSGDGDFGFLDVGAGWDVSPDDSCPNSDGDDQLEWWIDGTDPVATLDLNYPNATWVCTRSGNHSEPKVWQSLRDLIGQTRVFPVVGVSPGDGQPAKTGNPKPKYNVIGFARMTIEEVLTVQDTGPAQCRLDAPLANPTDLLARGKLPVASGGCGLDQDALFIAGTADVQQPGNPDTWSVSDEGVLSWSGGEMPTRATFDAMLPSTDCGGVPAPNSSAHCLVLTWVGYSFEHEPADEGENFGMVALGLCDEDYDSCVGPNT
ncbi:MAG TPA: pilus assembly protein TadG-related protein [Actinomycetota bacterium]